MEEETTNAKLEEEKTENQLHSKHQMPKTQELAAPGTSGREHL